MANILSDREKEILNIFACLTPKLAEMEKEKLLSFAEGMAFVVNERQDEERKAS